MIWGGRLIDGARDRGGRRRIHVIVFCCLLYASSHMWSRPRWLWVAVVRCCFNGYGGFSKKTWAYLEACTERCSLNVKRIVVAQWLVHDIFVKEMRVYFWGCCHLKVTVFITHTYTLGCMFGLVSLAKFWRLLVILFGFSSMYFFRLTSWIHVADDDTCSYIIAKIYEFCT